MRKILGVLWRLVKWGALALLVVVAIAFAVNARDEKLSPEAQALMQLPANPYRPDQNIYVALLGFDAPVGESVIVRGQAKIDHYNGLLDEQLKDPLFTMPTPWPAGFKALKFQGKTELGHPRDYSFWPSVRDNGSKIDQLLAANRELYQRFLALRDLPGYFEIELPSVFTDIAYPPTELRNLFLARFALLMQTGSNAQKHQAMIDFGRDINLWRRVLAGDGALISKMLAIASIQNDYLVLSDLLADPHTSIPEEIDSCVPDVNVAEWNIGKAFASEFQFHLFMHKQIREIIATGWQPPGSSDSRAVRWFMRAVWGPLGGWFFKVNATENLEAQLMNELARESSISPATFELQRVRYQTWLGQHDSTLHAIYNPMGKILVDIAAPTYGNYPLRAYDAAALQRLVRLSLEIRQHQIAFADIPVFMKQHPEWSTHPASGSAFSWNANAGEISIHTVSQQPADRRFAVRVWRKLAE